MVFRLTAEELDRLEGSESDLEQRRLLDQVVITRDLPVTMRTLQVLVQVLISPCGHSRYWYSYHHADTPVTGGGGGATGS